jgi:hypothetical protein
VEQNLENTIALLARTPAALDAFLRGLPEMWTETGEGEGTWSVSTVIAHLIHAEHDDWMPRATVILQAGETQPFPPFPRDGYVRFKQGKALGDLLYDFANVRAQNLDALRSLNLTLQDLQRTGHHPSFGPVTLSQLLATWAAHDLTHLHQISRIMAHQYRESVGPWTRFLGVMQCTGHSASA